MALNDALSASSFSVSWTVAREFAHGMLALFRQRHKGKLRDSKMLMVVTENRALTDL
jgi:hypothetical protein